jgi:hypothetical protein
MFKGLPELCYALDVTKGPDKGRAIIIKRGESGYYPTDWPDGYTQEIIDELNKRCGITKAQAEAMHIGSMFGWDVPAANPDWYDPETGRPIPLKKH